MTNLFKYTLLIFLLSFAACNSDDDGAPSVPNGQPQPGDALELTVSAADFVTDGAPDTRATDNGKETTFDDNDRVGVIILDAGDNLIYDNIPYVYKSGKWTFDSNNDEGKGGCYYDPKAKTYIVYYPYSRAADGVKNVEVLKTKFAPKFNQSDIKDYRSSDLMVWSSSTHLSSSEKELNAELKHAFASVYLIPTVKGVILDDGNRTPYTGSNVPEVSDVSLTIDNTVYVPFQATDGSLRCIVPAGITPGDIRCFYTIGSKTYGNVINISDKIAVNTCYVCEPEIRDVTYNLSNAHVGDFYCKNSKNKGYLIPGDVTLTAEQKATCIGIVFWLEDTTAKDQILKSDYKDCTHGLVVALQDAIDGKTAWQIPYCSVQDWLNNHSQREYLPVTNDISADYLNNIQGYNNTKAIEEFNAANLENLVLAVSTVDTYRTKVIAPINSSDWYLPSVKELALLCGRDVENILSGTVGTANRNLINRKIRLIGSAATVISSARYWSSTEFDNPSKSGAFLVNFDNGRVYFNYKGDTNRDNYNVRCVLAF